MVYHGFITVYLLEYPLVIKRGWKIPEAIEVAGKIIQLLLGD